MLQVAHIGLLIFGLLFSLISLLQLIRFFSAFSEVSDKNFNQIWLCFEVFKAIICGAAAYFSASEHHISPGEFALALVLFFFGAFGLQLIQHIRDITGVFPDEDAQVKKLMRSSNIVSLVEIIGGFLHEVNNQLGIINLRLALLDAEVKEAQKPAEELSKDIDAINVAAIQIGTIVKNLANFTRDSSNEPTRTVPAKAIADAALSFCATRFRNHTINLTVDLPDSQVTVDCKFVQMSQVLVNLLNNAFDAINKLPEKWIKLKIIATEDGLEMSVTDSGNGIPDEIRERIMSPLFSTKTSHRSTGLGLTICQNIVRAHGGQLIVDKDCPNTRFVVWIPLKQPKEAEETTFAA